MPAHTHTQAWQLACPSAPPTPRPPPPPPPPCRSREGARQGFASRHARTKNRTPMPARSARCHKQAPEAHCKDCREVCRHQVLELVEAALGRVGLLAGGLRHTLLLQGEREGQGKGEEGRGVRCGGRGWRPGPRAPAPWGEAVRCSTRPGGSSGGRGDRQQAYGHAWHGASAVLCVGRRLRPAAPPVRLAGYPGALMPPRARASDGVGCGTMPYLGPALGLVSSLCLEPAGR